MLEIKAINHRDKAEELVDLFNLVFNKSVSYDYWVWKHLKNPSNPPDPKVIVAMDGKKIVGANLFMPLIMRIGSERVNVLQSCDTMVHPDYRRRGIFFKIVNYAAEYYLKQGYDLFLGFPNDNSYPGFLKLGWQSTFPLESMLLISNPSAVFTRVSKNATAGKALGFFYDKIYNRQTEVDNKHTKNISFQFSNSMPDDLTQLDVLYDNDKFELERSKEFLKWRLDKNPLRDYKYILIKHENNLVAYGVVGGHNANGLNTGYVIDYLIKNQDLAYYRLFIDKALQELFSCEYDIIYTWEMSNHIFRQELLTRFNFKTSLDFPYRRFKKTGFFITRELNRDKMRRIDANKPNAWKISLLYPDYM